MDFESLIIRLKGEKFMLERLKEYLTLAPFCDKVTLDILVSMSENSVAEVKKEIEDYNF